MSTNENSSIQRQKSDVFYPVNSVKLNSSCVVNGGILCLSDSEKEELAVIFEEREESTSFFVPASGSGSRMFTELINFIQSGEQTELVNKFFEKLPELGLYREFPVIVREKIQDLQPVYIAEYLISEEGMNFLSRPKGLIPFHVLGDRVYNPFQEQLQQALEILGENGKIHFTIQEGKEAEVKSSLMQLSKTALEENVSFSVQDSHSNSFCFEEDGSIVIDNGLPLKRPAGHGALLENLNNLYEDLILIKNIDNVQHCTKSDLNREVWRYCGGLLIQFKKALAELAQNYSEDGLMALNQKYQFLSDEEVAVCDAMNILNYASRPSRVCGMVVNEGAPGGGPYWIEEDEMVSKQIVEKIQIEANDLHLIEESSHFNPVFIALSKSDCFGKLLDLTRFVDVSKYLVVSKPYQGRTIKYKELPGLWNGGMSNWNSIFVEVPKEVFSPVKSLFDLLDEAHQAL